MSNRHRSIIQPMTAEQQQKQLELSQGLCDAERQAVVAILAQERTPGGLMNVLNNATGFAQTMAGKLRHPRTPSVDCKEGCNYCCYQTVPVTAPEAFAIAEFIATTQSESEVEATRTKLLDVNQKTQSLTPKERTKRHIACAFLVEGRCSIYSVRPLACAEFTSMDLNDCKRAYRVGFKPKGIIHEKARMIAFYAIRQGLLDGLRESLPALHPEHYELTAAVIAALASNSAESWLAGNDIFERAGLVLDNTKTQRSEDGAQQTDGE